MLFMDQVENDSPLGGAPGVGYVEGNSAGRHTRRGWLTVDFYRVRDDPGDPYGWNIIDAGSPKVIQGS